MGLDYIRAQAGKPWRKRWNGGLDRLKASTLLDLTVTEAARTVTAELTTGADAARPHHDGGCAYRDC
jgi:hypothetical protein